MLITSVVAVPNVVASELSRNAHAIVTLEIPIGACFGKPPVSVPRESIED